MYQVKEGKLVINIIYQWSRPACLSKFGGQNQPLHTWRKGNLVMIEFEWSDVPEKRRSPKNGNYNCISEGSYPH